MDKVIEKMSKLNASNQSMDNTVLNQSTTAPTRPAPARINPAPSTIAPVSPSVAPQSLNFILSDLYYLCPRVVWHSTLYNNTRYHQ